MIGFSGCKINLGLNITSKRADGYHNIESVMYPVHSLRDAIEIIPWDKTIFSSSGIIVDCPDDKNLCMKAYNLLRARFDIPPVRIHLHKTIPFGAGLGGGSSNAVAVLKILRDMFSLSIAETQMEHLAAELGSDTVFFVKNTPAFVCGRGEMVEPIVLDLSGYYLVLVKPNQGVSTAEAYSGITPQEPLVYINDILKEDISYWKDMLTNDFEKSVFAKCPVLAQIKKSLYADGALYAAMSGSGSTIFSIFKTAPLLHSDYDSHFIHIGQL